MIASIIIGFIGMVTGLYISYFTDLPSGATIILVLTAFFAIGEAVLWGKRKIVKQE
jgi:ABC-type Mn2+/Zn2+ transport system permease subunit